MRYRQNSDYSINRHAHIATFSTDRRSIDRDQGELDVDQQLRQIEEGLGLNKLEQIRQAKPPERLSQQSAQQPGQPVRGRSLFVTTMLALEAAIFFAGLYSYKPSNQHSSLGADARVAILRSIVDGKEMPG